MKECSVIITAYNSSKTIESAVSSVTRQSIQAQIIVVDDQSNDVETLKAILIEYRSKGLDVTLVENKKKGNANISRNIGIKEAKYEVVALLDADDTWEPFHLNNAIESLMINNADLCLSKVQFVKNGMIQPYSQPEYKGDIADYIFNNGVAVTSAIVAKRDSLLKCMFDEAQLKHQDWDFLIRFEKQFKICQSQYTGLNYTLSSGTNMSSRFNPAATVRFINKTLPIKYHKVMLLSQLNPMIEQRDLVAISELSKELKENYRFKLNNLGFRLRLYPRLFYKRFSTLNLIVYKITDIGVRVLNRVRSIA